MPSMVAYPARPYIKDAHGVAPIQGYVAAATTAADNAGHTIRAAGRNNRTLATDQNPWTRTASLPVLPPGRLSRLPVLYLSRLPVLYRTCTRGATPEW